MIAEHQEQPRYESAVIYCRVSSVKQVEEGHGLDSQETRCREFATRKGYNVLAVFADKGISGGALDRPKMREMLSFLLRQPNEGTVVIIDDLNRFSRDVRVHWQLREMLKNAGGLLESPSMKFGDTSDDVLIENLLASVSQHQRQKNGEQVSHRMRARVMNGYAVVSKLLGYKYQQTKTEGKVLVRDEPVASIIQEALEGYASGYFATKSEVKRFLEAQPDYPKTQLHPTRIKVMLTNPMFAGYIKSEALNVSLRKARHEGLISFEVFEKIQSRLEEAKLAPARKDIHLDFPLRGFVTCGDCGKPLRGCWSQGKKKKYPYYLCQTKDCESYGKSIRQADIEDEFFTLLEQMRPNANLFHIIKDMVYNAWNQRTAQMDEIRKSLRREILNLEKQIDGYLDKIVDASSDRVINAIDRKINQLEKQKLLAGEKLEKYLAPQPTSKQMLEHPMQFLANPCKLWESGNIHLQKLVLRLAFSEPLSYDRNKGYRTPKTTLPFNILGGFYMPNLKMVVDAVQYEPVSTARFPCFAGIYRE